MSRTIFITGASSGLGKATAKLFAQQGWKVIATMRNPEKETELNHLKDVSLLQLDVSNAKEIKEVTENVLQKGDVDVVFNNAGYILFGPLEAVTDDQLVREVDTNLLSVIRITQAFIPHFRTKRRGLFITTTSLSAIIPEPFTAVYRATKSALEAWTETMTFELSEFNIGIKTVVPGFMKTSILTGAYQAQHEAYAEQVGKVMAVFTDPAAASIASEPEEIAQVVYEAATDGKDQLRYVAGADAKTRYEQLQKKGDEAIRKATSKTFFGR